MKAIVTKCDRCGFEILRDGFSMSICPWGDGTYYLDIRPGINHDDFHSHFCGKECLMLVLNDEVEKIKAAPVAATTGAR